MVAPIDSKFLCPLGWPTRNSNIAIMSSPSHIPHHLGPISRNLPKEAIANPSKFWPQIPLSVGMTDSETRTLLYLFLDSKQFHFLMDLFENFWRKRGFIDGNYKGFFNYSLIFYFQVWLLQKCTNKVYLSTTDPIIANFGGIQLKLGN